MRFGLNENVVDKINEVPSHFPAIDEAILYGSRAKGNYKNGLDIDLTLKGDGLTTSILNNISGIIDDMPIPYTVDLSILLAIKNQELLDHINGVGISL